VFNVVCIPANDPNFENAVRVIVEFVQVDGPPRAPEALLWEGALHHGFGYHLAEVRVHRVPGGGASVIFYREGVRRAAMSGVAAGEEVA